jgi:hypothetical protein
MCGGSDNGSFIMQKTWWCDSLYRQNISTLEIHSQLMLVFGEVVLRPRHVGRGWREFKSWLASITKITPFSSADKEYICTAQVVAELVFGKPSRHSSRFIHCSGVICENCTQNCPCTVEIQQCMCLMGTMIHDGSPQKLMFAGALHIFSHLRRSKWVP